MPHPHIDPQRAGPRSPRYARGVREDALLLPQSSRRSSARACRGCREKLKAVPRARSRILGSTKLSASFAPLFRCDLRIGPKHEPGLPSVPSRSSLAGYTISSPVHRGKPCPARRKPSPGVRRGSAGSHPNMSRVRCQLTESRRKGRTDDTKYSSRKYTEDLLACQGARESA